MPYLLAFAVGVLSGLRSFTPLTVISWAASLGSLSLEGTWLSFLAHRGTAYLLTVLAIAELIADKLPKTPSRKSAIGFSGRIILGGLSGAAVGAQQSWIAGLVLGVLGAIFGTFAGYEFRVRAVRATGGRDLPIALLEDIIAIGGAILTVSRL